MSVFLISCGAGAGSPSASISAPISVPLPTSAPAPGALLGPATLIATLSQQDLDTASATAGYQAQSGKALCQVKVIAIDYATLGVKGEAANASGVLLVPSPTAGSSNAICTQPAALVTYGKSTDVQKARTLAHPQDEETLLLATMYAARGYVVVASDYLGYAKSTYPFHPYLHADSEATSLLDAVRAARIAAPAFGAALSGKVMLSGYSQGAHASMAAQRAAERSVSNGMGMGMGGMDITITAAAHLAGPYDLAGMVKSGAVVRGYQFLMPFMVTAWQKIYGNVYTKADLAFNPPYAQTIESLLPSATHNFTSLLDTNALPGGHAETPGQLRDALFQPSYLANSQTNPSNPLYQAALANTLLGWLPQSATLLCAGSGDPTAPLAMHQAPLKADFDSRSTPLNRTKVVTLDMDSAIQATFGQNGKAPTDPSTPAYARYFEAYHTVYQPPLCHAAARALFDGLR